MYRLKMLKTLIKSLIVTVSVLTAATIVTSCNKDDVIEQDVLDKPSIALDNETGIYVAKVNREITIAPSYINASGASYLWTIDGTPVADTPELIYTWTEPGDYYVTITVSTPGGSATEELKVEVTELGAPVISLPISGNSITILVGSNYKICPEISNTELDDFKIEWYVNGQSVCTGMQYLFSADNVGDYIVSVSASNIDGTDSKEFTIHVVETLPIEIKFPTPTFFNSNTTRYTFPGRSVYLTPIISGDMPQTYLWTVDGIATQCNDLTYIFTPEKPGEYQIGITVNDEYTATVNVVCVNSSENARYRKATAGSHPTSTRVFEWVPAPGQFIGETKVGGMIGNETTVELANEWAEKRLAKQQYVSLGGWGGYIIVGFDHSITKQDGQFDFAIMGNAFLNESTGTGGSNEPGIVYVMQDINGNGLPDDEWYELRGCQTGASGTIQHYAVTYYKPSGPAMNVLWTDNQGNQGYIDYLSSFHSQDSYYPAWISSDSYTLYGTRLEARTTQNPSTGMWDNWLFEWGYSDNMGSDNMGNNDNIDGSGQRNGFRIENAMQPDQSYINLQYIDFIKVQTGVNAKAGWLGENSTEVFNFQDLSLMK